tara:strand:+ start:352 stop:966 length:615 start_codon:yes stop_codon:yes gene_type:complete
MENTRQQPEGSIQPLWATPIYQNQAKGEEFDEVQEELLSTISKLKFKEAKGWGPHSHDLSENAFESNFLIEKKCVKSLKFIHKCLTEYISFVGAKQSPYAIISAWITRTNKGKFAHPHSHGFSDVSGVYYINTNGKDGNLMFDNIHDAFGGNFIYNAIGGKVPAPLDNGIILMWPSNLRHETQENTTDNERLSLSFNINFNRMN